jgi:Holliday junction resolvase-like predicted endonuclease
MVKNKMEESIIQTKIKDHLKKRGYLVVKIIQCTLNGWPDLMAMKDGKCVFIEVKRDGEPLAPLQEYRRGQIRKAGCQHITAWGIDDVKHLI